MLYPVRLETLAQVHLQAVTLAAPLVPRQVLDLVQYQVRRRLPLRNSPDPALVCHRHQSVDSPVQTTCITFCHRELRIVSFWFFDKTNNIWMSEQWRVRKSEQFANLAQ